HEISGHVFLLVPACPELRQSQMHEVPRMSRFDKVQRAGAIPILARMKNLFLPALAVLMLVAGCNDGVHWSKREQDNGEYLLAALRLTSEAATIANSIETEADLDTKREPLLRALRSAQWNAAQVDDHVLDKLHPALYGRF